MIEARFVIDESHRHLRHAAMRKLNPGRYFQFVYAGVGLLGGLIYGITLGFGMLPVALVTVSILAFALEAKRRTAEKLHFESSYTLGSEVVWQFGEEGIRVENQGDIAEMAWEKLFRVERIPQGLAVAPSSQHYQVIPESAFKEVSQMDRVMEIFLERRRRGG